MALKTKATLAAEGLSRVPVGVQREVDYLDKTLTFIGQEQSQILADLTALQNNDDEIGATGIRKSELASFVSVALTVFKRLTGSTKHDGLATLPGVAVITDTDLPAEIAQRNFR